MVDIAEKKVPRDWGYAAVRVSSSGMGIAEKWEGVQGAYQRQIERLLAEGTRDQDWQQL